MASDGPHRVPSGRAGRAARRFGYLVGIGANLVALYVLNNLYAWGLPAITAGWADVLWAVHLSIGASIVAHVIWLFYDAPPFKAVMQMIVDGFGLLSIYTVLTVFPFAPDRQLLEQLLRLALTLVLLATGIGIVVRFVRLVMGRYE